MKAGCLPVAAIAAMAFACKSSSHLEKQQTATAAIESRTESGPVTITTTVDEYAGDLGDWIPDGGSASPDRAPVPDSRIPKRAKAPAPRLVRHTVQVEQRGPVISESHAAVATESKAVEEKKSAPSTGIGCGIGLGLGGALLVLVLIAAWRIYRLWRGGL